MSPEEPHVFLSVLALLAVGFGLAPLVLAALWRRRFAPAKPGHDKNATYECGLEARGDARIRFHSGYYLYAIIFLIFEVEALFLIPFAVAFSGLPLGSVVGMSVFILLLLEGWVWAWHRGLLAWR